MEFHQGRLCALTFLFSVVNFPGERKKQNKKQSVVIEWPCVCLLLSNSETMCWWILGLWFLRLLRLKFCNIQQQQIRIPQRLEHPLLSDVLFVYCVLPHTGYTCYILFSWFEAHKLLQFSQIKCLNGHNFRLCWG